MKRHSIHSEGHSCTNCAYQSHSNTAPIQKLINEGSKIDRLYYGKFLRRHENKLLERLVRTRAEYDDALGEHLSSSDSNNFEDHERMYKHRAGHGKPSSCCSCCSCSSYRKIKKHLENHPSHVHKHCVPIDVVKEYVAKAELKAKERQSRLSTKISSQIRVSHSKIRQIHSEPCRCTLSLISMATTSMTRSSKTVMKRMHPKNKRGADHKKNLDEVKYKTETCECPCKRICKIPIQSLHKIRSIKGRTEKKLKIKKDSKTLFKDKVKKKKAVVECKCDSEKYFKRTKKVGEAPNTKHRDRPSPAKHKVSVGTRIPNQKTQFASKESLIDIITLTKTASSMTSTAKAIKQKHKATTENLKPDKTERPKSKVKKITSRKQLKKDQIGQAAAIKPTKSISSMTTKFKEKKPSPKPKKPLTSESKTTTPEIEVKTVSSSATILKSTKISKVPKPKKENKSASKRKAKKAPEEELEEEDVCGKRVVRISSSFKFEIQFSKEKLPCVDDYEDSEYTQTKRHEKEIKGRKVHTKRAQVSFDKKHGRDSQTSFFRETRSQTSRYRPDIVHSRECGTSICKRSKCSVDCEKLLATSIYLGRSVTTATDRTRRKTTGSTTSSFMTDSRSRYSQSEIKEPHQSVEEHEEEDIRHPHRRAVRISSSFTLNIEFLKDNYTDDDQDFPDTQREKYKEIKEDYKPKTKQKGTLPKKIKFGNTLTLKSSSSQSIQMAQVTPLLRLKRCFCTLTMQERKEQKITHVNSKKTMINLPNREKSARIRKTQTKSTKNAYVYPPDKAYSLRPYDCEPSFCTPKECDPNVCLKRIKERNQSIETNTIKTPNSSVSTSMPSTKIPSKKVQSSEYIQKKKKIRRTQDTPAEASVMKPGKRLVRVGSSFSLNVEFSKENIGEDNECMDHLECQEHSRQERKLVYPSGIKVHKPRGHHVAADTATNIKSKEAHTIPFLQRCFCTLKLLNKGKKKNQNTISTDNKHDRGMHIHNREVTANRAIITYHRIPRNSIYKLKTYESEKRLKKICDMQLLTDEFSRALSKKPYIQSQLKEFTEIMENNVHIDNPQVASSQSQQTAKIGSKLDVNVGLYKKSLSDNRVKRDLRTSNDRNQKFQADFISNSKALNQVKIPHKNKIIIATAGTKGIYIDTERKSHLSSLKFHKRGKIAKFNEARAPFPNPHACISRSTNTSSTDGIYESNSETTKISKVSNFSHSKSSTDKHLQRFGKRYISTEGSKSEKIIISNSSGLSKTKSAQSRSITHTPNQQEKVAFLHSILSTNSPLTVPSPAVRTEINSVFNIKSRKDRLLPAVQQPSNKIRTVKRDNISDDLSVQKLKDLNIKEKHMLLKSSFSQTSYGRDTTKSNKDSNMSLFKRCLCSLGIQKKSNITGGGKPESTNTSNVSENGSNNSMPPSYVKVNKRDCLNISSKKFFNLPHIRDLMKPRLQINQETFPKKMSLTSNRQIDQTSTKNANNLVKNLKERVPDQTMKTNPYYRSIYALNLQVSNKNTNKHRHKQANVQKINKNYRNAKKSVIDDNECELGCCTGCRCEPIDCSERMRSRHKRPHIPDTEQSSTILKTTKRKHKQAHSFNNYSNNRKYALDTRPSHHVVTVGSNFQFSMEFSKALPHFSSRAAQKNDKHAATRSCRKHLEHVQSQISTISHNQAKGISTALERCFCTNKLKNKHNQIKKVLKSREQATMAKKPVALVTCNKNKHVTTKKLKPYECAPGVCIPGECDPYKCSERIQQRYKKYIDNAVCTDRLKCKSTSNLARPPKPHLGSKAVQAKSYSTQKSKISKKSTSHKTEHPRNKSVKFGSNMSFNVEFFRDKTNSISSEFTPEPAKYRHGIQKMHRKSEVSSSNRISRKGSGDTRKRSKDRSMNTRHDIKMEDKGNCVADIFNKCYCSLKLTESKNAKKRLHRKSKSVTFKSASNTSPTCITEHVKIKKHKPNIPKRKSLADKRTQTRKNRTSKSFEHVDRATKNKVKVEEKRLEIHKIRRQNLFEKSLKSSKTNLSSNQTDNTICFAYRPTNSGVMELINKCLCKLSRNGKKLTPKPSLQSLVKRKKSKRRRISKQKLTKKRRDDNAEVNKEMKTIYPYSKKKFKRLESQTKLDNTDKTVKKHKQKHRETSKLCPECKVAYETFIGEPIASVPYREPGNDDEPCAFCKSRKKEIKKKSKKSDKKHKPPRIVEREINLGSYRERKGAYYLQTKVGPSQNACPFCKGHEHSDIPGYEPVKMCTCGKSSCRSFVEKAKSLMHGDDEPSKHRPLFDVYVNKKMNITNTHEVFQKIEPTSDIFRRAKGTLEAAKAAGNDIPHATDLYIDKRTGKVINDDEVLRKLLPYHQWLKLRKEYYKAALKKGPITCKALKALNTPLRRSIDATMEHNDTCPCCACAKKRKKKRRKQGKGGKDPPTSGIPTSVGERSVPDSSRLSTTKKKVNKPPSSIKRSKFSPCICGSPPCKQDWEKLKRAAQPMKKFKVKKCSCGVDNCRFEAMKVSLELEKAYLRARKAKEEQKALRKYLIERSKRKLQYAAEDRKKLKQRKRQDAADMKILKKRLPNMPEVIKVTDSIVDCSKFQVKAGSDILRCLCRLARHPRDGWYNLKEIVEKPQESANSMVESCKATGFFATMSRIKKRIGSMAYTKKVVKILESYPITNFILHAGDKSAKHRLKTFKKVKSKDIDFDCDLQALSMRWKPFLSVYKKCPRLYPFFVDTLICFRQVADVMLFILAVLVWTPCIICTELCRALMCCCMCTT